jgi:pimeloyl-ACP methyl ester carboxylesterase
VTPGTVRRAAYQFVVGAPLVGARVQRHAPLLGAIRKLSAAPWTDAELEVFAERYRSPAHAEATSRLYRVFLAHERAAIHGGAYADRRLTVPTRMLAGRQDPVVSPAVLAGYEAHADDMAVEWVDGTHWLPEEAPEVVADRLLHMPGAST